MITLPVPLSVPEVEPEPLTTCTFTPLKTTVGLPPGPAAVNRRCGKIEISVC
jgi:hypothetical protein